MKNLLFKYFNFVLYILSASGGLHGMEEKEKQKEITEPGQKFAVFDNHQKSVEDLIQKAKAIFANLSSQYEGYIEEASFDSKESWGFQALYFINRSQRPVGPKNSGELPLEGFMNFRVREYKIHLMPETKDIPKYLKMLLEQISKNLRLEEAIWLVKAVILYPENDYKELGGVPKIVISVPRGKEKAQFVLDCVCSIFKKEKGSGQSPKYNEKVTDFIFFTQGNRDDKLPDRPYANLIYEDSKIYYDPKKIEKAFDIKLWDKNPDYHLINPGFLKNLGIVL